MRFGLFGSAQAVRGGPEFDRAAGYHDFIDSNIEAENLGYCSTFLVEHHFTGFGQVSATLNLLTWLGARTSTLRLGTAVLVLPWHNPVLLAEQAAALDLLSGGRLDFGIGKGYRYNEFAGFCIPMEEADARFEEALAVIVKAWTCDTPWSHRGKYWRFENIIVEPPTAQKPHPPFWMGAGSPESIRVTADRGYNLLLDQFASVDQIGQRIALYKSAVEARGRRFDPLSVGVTRSVRVVANTAERDKAIDARMTAHRRIGLLAQRPDGRQQSTFGSYANTREVAEAGALYGTPDEIMVMLEALRNAGAEYVLLNSAGGINSLRRFAREVMPAFSRDSPLRAAD